MYCLWWMSASDCVVLGGTSCPYNYCDNSQTSHSVRLKGFMSLWRLIRRQTVTLTHKGNISFRCSYVFNQTFSQIREQKGSFALLPQTHLLDCAAEATWWISQITSCKASWDAVYCICVTYLAKILYRVDEIFSLHASPIYHCWWYLLLSPANALVTAIHSI